VSFVAQPPPEDQTRAKGPKLDPEKKPPFRSTRLYRKPTPVGAQRMLRRMEE
jgi:hypothetical protein